jgi:hypothetical protein
VAWLTFLLIALGIVAAAFALAALLLGRADRPRLKVAAGATVVVAAVAVAFPITRDSVEAINGVRRDIRGTPPAQAKEKCIVDGGAGDIVPLVERMRASMPPRAPYQVVGPTRTDVACLTTNMLPRLVVSNAGRGGWVVFTDGVPKEWIGRLTPGSLQRVSPSVAFGRVQG